MTDYRFVVMRKTMEKTGFKEYRTLCSVSWQFIRPAEYPTQKWVLGVALQNGTIVALDRRDKPKNQTEYGIRAGSALEVAP